MTAFAALLLCALAGAPAAAHAGKPARELTVLVVVGTGGEENYEVRFHREADEWKALCAKAGVECKTIGTDKMAGGVTDAALLRGWIEKFTAESRNALWIVLIGHGSYDGREARFNLRGPDVTVAEFAAWLKPMTRDLAVINAAPASAPFVKELSGPRRVIVTATKSADEVFATRFGGYFVKAVAGEAMADQDGDGQVSLLEAFLWASRQVARFYEGDGRLATEHAMIDDNGDGAGTRAEMFEGLRLAKKPDAGKSGDGLLARQWVLLLNEAEAKLGEETRRRRDELEREAEGLRAKKDSMKAEDYYRELDRVFLEIAKLHRAGGEAEEIRKALR